MSPEEKNTEEETTTTSKSSGSVRPVQKTLDKLSLAYWAKASPISFGVPPEVVFAALPEGRYTKLEVQQALEKYKSTPAEVR